MHTLNIHAAKTQLSKLVERVERGESFIIARAGRPVARLEPLKKSDLYEQAQSTGVRDGTGKAQFEHPNAQEEGAPPRSRPRRRLGFLKGQMSIPDDFNEMGRDEIERLFNGDE